MDIACVLVKKANLALGKLQTKARVALARADLKALGNLQLAAQTANAQLAKAPPQSQAGIQQAFDAQAKAILATLATDRAAAITQLNSDETSLEAALKQKKVALADTSGGVDGKYDADTDHGCKPVEQAGWQQDTNAGLPAETVP